MPEEASWRESHSVRIAVLEQQLRDRDIQLALQAKEYERRLDELNHAHDKQVEDQRTYVSEDKFAGYASKMDTWRNDVSLALAQLQGQAGGKGSVGRIVVQVLTLLISGAVLVALFWVG
jgi:recombinational DNA repair ATPase RecF